MSDPHDGPPADGPVTVGDEAGQSPAEPQQADGGSVPQEGAPEAMVSEPAKLMRIGMMLRELRNEVHSAQVDQAGLERLGEVHGRAVEGLRSVISSELRDELDELSPSLPTDHQVSESEVRLAQAQLIGWLEGLFQGIQAAIASQQQAARQQLEQMRAQRALGSGGQGEHGAGQYL